MGLDQYAYARDPRIQRDEEDEDDWGGDVHIMDWRKHNRLQGYMEQLWESKGCPIPATSYDEDEDEEDEDDLQVIYNPSEVAELSRHAVDDPPEEADPPEVAGMEEAPPMSLSETEGGYLFGTRGTGDTGERFVPFRY